MEGSKAPPVRVGVEGPADLAAPAMRKRSIRLPSFKRTASKPVMEQVVEDVEATPKKDVRQFMRKALVKRDPTVVTSPEEDEMSVVTLDSAAATVGSTARHNPFSPSGRRALSPLEARSLDLDAELEGAEESKEGS